VWADPSRALATLESFARTEEDGGRDIATAARRVTDVELRGHLERHARDEVRHAELFRRRARELRESGVGGADATAGSEKGYDLSRGRPSAEVDAHGFFRVGLLDELGELPYVAMLHVAEQRAARLFDIHARLTRDDPPTHEIFREILRDERYHVAWTAAMLERWRQRGDADAVRRALKTARTGRAMGAWKRAGARAGVGFGRVLMLVTWVTLMVPFGLVARRRRGGESGWMSARRTRATAAAAERSAARDALTRLRSQA